MTDFKEEAYVLEKMEISEDEDDGFEYKEINESEGSQEQELAMESLQLDDDDLNDFDALKTKTEAKRLALAKKQGTQVSVED